MHPIIIVGRREFQPEKIADMLEAKFGYKQTNGDGTQNILIASPSQIETIVSKRSNEMFCVCYLMPTNTIPEKDNEEYDAFEELLKSDKSVDLPRNCGAGVAQILYDIIDKKAIYKAASAVKCIIEMWKLSENIFEKLVQSEIITSIKKNDNEFIASERSGKPALSKTQKFEIAIISHHAAMKPEMFHNIIQTFLTLPNAKINIES